MLKVISVTGLFVCTMMSAWSAACASPIHTEYNEARKVSSQKTTPISDGELTSGDCHDPIWSDQIGDKVIEWKKDEIFVGPSNNRTAWFMPSFMKLHRAEIKTLKSNLNSLSNVKGLPSRQPMTIHSEAYVDIASIVGNIVSFEIEYGSYAVGNAATHRIWLVTVDISKKGIFHPFSEEDIENIEMPMNADIRDLFPHSAILSALVANQDFKDGLFRSKQISLEKVKQIIEHKDQLEDFSIRIGTAGDVFTLYSFEHFVFDRIEGESVVMRLALVRGGITDNYEIPFIEVKLPIPGNLSEALSSAAKNENGFLRIDQKTISMNCSTMLALETTLR